MLFGAGCFILKPNLDIFSNILERNGISKIIQGSKSFLNHLSFFVPKLNEDEWKKHFSWIIERFSKAHSQKTSYFYSVEDNIKVVIIEKSSNHFNNGPALSAFYFRNCCFCLKIL